MEKNIFLIGFYAINEDDKIITLFLQYLLRLNNLSLLSASTLARHKCFYFR
ncbi:hypothetical protein A1OE_974 [Candidatus Endolissoclinum faulkneri L2]|uniref:Uncharacterized protein n=1 Tax=Candidatus Endolissoclinum faulkneri L2 TaxID=1193729 RepID=K7YHT3_9PROT|nr:hypothetical protein A1OE_974 [Candidatus Endolissoclinum faulkneri L2]